MKAANEELFRSITVEMDSLFTQKNADYGNSYAELYARYGSIYPLIRLEEKIARVERLTTSEKDPEVKSESLRDTLIDLFAGCGGLPTYDTLHSARACLSISRLSLYNI